MIEATGLTKVYGGKTAVDGVSFTVQAGQVTGFLGPNGAGKSTTMRMIMGLDRPTSGSVTVNGLPYAQHKAPLHEVGALLDAKAVHTSRSAYNHLLAMAATHSIPKARVHEVIEMTGLEAVAKKKAGGFSLGMGQRLGIAAALLGDPQTLILDEPVNGLDPEGVLWVRNLVRYLANQGKTVFLSSHLMSEMAQTADHLIVIGRGRIIADAPVKDIIAGTRQVRTLVRTGDATQLCRAAGGQRRHGGPERAGNPGSHRPGSAADRPGSTGQPRPGLRTHPADSSPGRRLLRPHQGRSGIPLAPDRRTGGHASTQRRPRLRRRQESKDHEHHD